MEGSAVRVESTPSRRRTLWPPLLRRRQVAITLPLRTIEHLFAPLEADPFSDAYERYANKPGVDAIAAVLHAERPVADVRVTVELGEDEADEAKTRQAPEAIRRYCRVRIADLDQELHLIRRYGVWALVIGAAAVLVLNAIANPLDSSEDDVLQLIAQGLQIAAWVTLWFPINLLVYDRWYARRDQAVYRDMLRLELSIVPERPAPA
jgi:hypothetical protein